MSGLMKTMVAASLGAVFTVGGCVKPTSHAASSEKTVRNVVKGSVCGTSHVANINAIKNIRGMLSAERKCVLIAYEILLAPDSTDAARRGGGIILKNVVNDLRELEADLRRLEASLQETGGVGVSPALREKDVRRK